MGTTISRIVKKERQNSTASHEQVNDHESDKRQTYMVPTLPELSKIHFPVYEPV